MNAKWYLQWAANHAAAFSFTEKGVESLVAWGGHWSKVFSQLELEHATSELMMDRRLDREGRPLLRWPDEHRVAIPAAIQYQRGRQRQIATRPADDECAICGDAGLRPVPHPGKNERGELRPHLSKEPYSYNQFGSPVYLELSVICDCRRGSSLFGSHVLRFVDYEHRYPNWRTVAETIASTRKPFGESYGNEAVDVEQVKRLLAASMSMPRKSYPLSVRQADATTTENDDGKTEKDE